MDKIKLEMKTPENITIEYNGVKIEIDPFIDFAEQVLLINEYTKDYFGNLSEVVIEGTKKHVFEAECRLKNYIIQLNTNIDMSEIDNNIYIDEKLWTAITEKIENYWGFRETLDQVIYVMNEQEKLDNSLGKVFSELLYKAEDFIDKLSLISPEDIKELQETGKGLIEELKESSVLSNPSDLSSLDTPLVNELKKE